MFDSLVSVNAVLCRIGQCSLNKNSVFDRSVFHIASECAGDTSPTNFIQRYSRSVGLTFYPLKDM